MSSHRHHTRWRAVVSSALVPTAVVFAIPGLAENWYQRKGATSETKTDPVLLIIGQSFGLFFNVLASVLLLFCINGSETMIITSSCIGSLGIAILLDLVCLSIFGTSHSNVEQDGYALSTAYYLTLSSGIMSLIAALLMTVDALKHDWVPYGRGKLLTQKQRRLAMRTFHFMAYLAIGSIVFRYLLDISYLDAIYFVMSSSLTVGYGDIVPNNTAARIFSFFYFPFGIILIGIIVSLIRGTVLANANTRLRRRIRNELQNPRMQERLANIQHWAKAGSSSAQFAGSNQTQQPVQSPTRELNSYFDSLREAIKEDAMTDHRIEIFLSFSSFIIFWVVGAVVYMILEGWDFFAAFYFTFVTYCTIGYGEYYPRTPGGRAFYIGWGVMGIIILTILFSSVAEAWTVTFSDILRKRVMRHQVKAVTRENDHEAGFALNGRQHIQEKQEHPHSTEAHAGEAIHDTQVDGNNAGRDTLMQIFSQDLRHFLDECEQFFDHLVNEDAEAMRQSLMRIIVEHDRIEDEVAWVIVDQDSDEGIEKLLLKHAQSEYRYSSQPR
ncbi:uncharacterized protein EI90DRAFT_3119742 [Cantharellus anzutake]|uniref:uncharacterized protein n=1 Tax=Cantharellus anzutake TaxID=1750568 RepID=UPI001905A184|nr:uncharacterized protein EI90DRAFT_3119742 [Cantharellus anzutake]KAF8336504.1 hypothetical protein EI90DRAFT_3119742 [Cantharellus anzutake]